MMQGPPLTFILPYRPENVSPVSLHPTKLVNHADSPEVSPLLNFCRSSPSLSLTLRREFELGGGVPGRAQLSETVRFMMRWRVDLLESGFKESGAEGKVETASSAVHAVFLPYKAPKYTNTPL